VLDAVSSTEARSARNRDFGQVEKTAGKRPGQTGSKHASQSILQPDGIGWRRTNAAEETRLGQRARPSERPLL